MTSIQIIDPAVIDKHISDPEFPYLISFPRTGSHWLRMIMELYLKTPSLVRIFYFKESMHFTCYHRHDIDLSIVRKNVLYLYRHPVDTVYSQMNYYHEDPSDAARVRHWATLYGRHLQKWLIEETFTTKKTILTYEEMKNDLTAAFTKVCTHFCAAFDKGRLAEAAKIVTREEVKKKTLHDPQVVNLTKEYARVKENFVSQFSNKILDFVYAVDPALLRLFTEIQK